MSEYHDVSEEQQALVDECLAEPLKGLRAVQEALEEANTPKYVIPAKKHFEDGGFVPPFLRPENPLTMEALREHRPMYVSFAEFLQMRDWLAQLRYRPGSTLTLEDGYGGILRLVQLCFNSYADVDPEVLEKGLTIMTDDGMRSFMTAWVGDLIKVTTTWRIPPYLRAENEQDRLAFKHWVRSCLHDWERHESDEWLREQVNGAWRPVFDPHA